MRSIFFVRSGELWRQRDGGARRLAGPNIVALAVSLTGGRVAVVQRSAERSELRVVDAQDGSSVSVFETPKLLTGPAWHPSGHALSLVVNDPDGRADLLFVEVDRSSDGTEAMRVVDGPHSLAEPTWSRDGRWLAIEGQPLDELRGMTVFLHNQADGTSLLIDPLELPEPKATCPRFAPHRPLLSYTYANIGALDSEIRLYDLTTGGRATIAGGGLNDPRWSEDGRFLLASHHRSICAGQLVRVDVSTGTIESLSDAGEHVSPSYLDSKVALYIARSCAAVDENPTDPGVLWEHDLRSGATVQIAEEASLAVAVMA